MTVNYHTDIAVAAPVNSAIVNAPLGQLDSAITTDVANLSNLQNGVSSFNQLSLGNTNLLTIAADTVTVTNTRHSIDTEAAAATDDLSTINGFVSGDLLILQLANAARLVRVRHNIGNIRLANGADIWLTGTSQLLILVYDLTSGFWIQEITPAYIRSVLTSTPITAQGINLPDKIYRATDGRNANNVPFLHVMPRPSVRGHFFEQSSNATFASVGIASGTNAGAGALTALTGAQAANDIFTNQTIANVAGTFGGRRSTTFNIWRRQHNPYFSVRLMPRTAVTNVRVWVGLTQAQVTNVDTLAAGTAGFFLRFSTVVPDSFWVALCNDGTNQSSVVSTGVTFVQDTSYDLEIWVDSGNGIAYFSVNGSTPVSVNTNLPSTTQDLGFTVSEITTTATAKDIAIARLYGEWGA